jgi:hypothetical protein
MHRDDSSTLKRAALARIFLAGLPGTRAQDEVGPLLRRGMAST